MVVMSAVVAAQAGALCYFDGSPAVKTITVKSTAINICKSCAVTLTVRLQEASATF